MSMSVYNHDVVNSINQIPNRDTLTHEDLRVFYGTGQSIHVSGTGRYKEYDYRVGVQTKIGDIKIDVWCQLAKELIKRSGEEHLYQRLFNWEKEIDKFASNLKYLTLTGTDRKSKFKEI